MRALEEFNITKPPEAGHADVGPWAWQVYELCRQWRDDELRMPEIWRANYSLFRGDHWKNRKKPNNVTINLFFSNVLRTVANVTARNPVAEIVSLEQGDEATDPMTGQSGEDMANVATARVKKWWLDTGQRAKLKATTLQSEIYGITWEKSVWNQRAMEPGIVVCDPFAIFPYPGVWENISTDCPAICHATALDPAVVEDKYGVSGVEISETYDLLGGDREEVTGTSSHGATRNSSPVGSGHSVKPIRAQSTGPKGENALVVEVWCRDFSTTKAEDGSEEPVYPGGIRCITICNEGEMVLADEANPNLNLELGIDVISLNYMYRRLPFWKANSYMDTSSLFGFSAAEQVAHLNVKIDELISRLVDYAMRAMTGILVIPPKSGITKAHLNNKPNLVLFPQTLEAANAIRFVSLPNPPPIIEKVSNMLMELHDRVHAIQDIDRGTPPGGVIAASAIVALQERNAVLIQHKIDAIDYMVGERGNFSVAQWQMHGHQLETVKVDDDTYQFSGVSLAGRDFNYVVESGSTMPKTSLQIQEQAMDLFAAQAIDRQALLENLNFPNWREIVERMSEKQLEAAMQVLIGAGMPEDQAAQLLQMLQQPQGGPGNRPQTPPQGNPQPGTPVAQQGDMHNAPI